MKQVQSDRMRELDPPLLVLKMEEDHKPKNSEQPSETGKGKETDSPLEPPETNAALLTP